MEYQVRQMTAVTLQVEDRIGMLSQVLHALRDARVNMLALVSQRKGGAALLGIPQDIETARKLAAQEGVSLTQREVFYVEGDDEVGALIPVTDALANARINIEDVYALATEGKYAAIYTVAAEDVERAAQALGIA